MQKPHSDRLVEADFEQVRRGYDPKLASGTVCTAGTLGQIIPPSTLLIILSDVMSNGYQQAQFAQGKFTVETISVGQVFAGALLPGLALVGLYIAYLLGDAKQQYEILFSTRILKKTGLRINNS